MNSRALRILAATWLSAALFGTVSASAQPELRTQERTITVVGDEWPPFNMIPDGIAPNRRREGYMIDILRAVFEPQGISIIYQLVPWNRALSDTRAGIYTAVVGASKVDGAGLVFPAEELAINRLGFYTLSTSVWTFDGVASLSEVSLGVIAGYDYREWLNDYIRRYGDDERRVQIMSGDRALEANFRKLLNGRIDAIVDSETSLRYTAWQLNVEAKVREAGRGSEPTNIYVAFSPESPYAVDLADMLSNGVRELRSNGRLASILAAYGLTDWKNR